MNLDLCTVCRRHVRTTETTCPFCGAAITPGPPALHPHSPTTRSRAQRYVLGAAVAAGIGVANASASTGEDAGSDTMAVASEPTPETAEDAGAMPGPEVPEAEQDRWREHRQGSPCTRAGCCGPVVCPPYGCVFPDEDCAIEHA